MQTSTQMLTQTPTMLCRQWTMMLMMDNNANNNAATQTMGDDADDDDAVADVNTTTKMIR